MAMTLRLPPELEDQLKQVAASEHRSVQQTVLVAIEEYLSMRETVEILADPAALRGLAEASPRSTSARSRRSPHFLSARATERLLGWLLPGCTRLASDSGS